MNILDLLRADGSIVVNKKLAHEIGLNEAVVYSELVSLFKYWSDRGELTEDGFFYCTNPNLKKNTAIEEKTLQRVTNRLVKLGLINKKQKGIPAKTHYRITNGIYNLFNDMPNKDRQIVQPDSDKGLDGKNSNKSHDRQHGQIVQPREDKLSELGKTNCPTNNTRINNTRINNDDDDNKESMHARVNKLVESHSYLQPLFGYLKGEMLDPSIVQNILIEMVDQYVYDYRLTDARNQIEYMKNSINNGDSFTFFARFFVNGLKKRSATTIDVEKEKQLVKQHQEKRDTSIYYNWLEE